MMDSKTYYKIIIISFIVFIVHLFLFNVLDGYGDFFKKIKYGTGALDQSKIDKNIETKTNSDENLYHLERDAVTNDPVIVSTKDYEDSDYFRQEVEPNYEDFTVIELNNSNKEQPTNTESNIAVTSAPSLNTTQNYILNRFMNYNLLEQKAKSSVIFSLTDEFPFDFTEYKSYDTNLSLYLFTEGSYDEIFNVFDVLSYDGTFKVRKVNNFGTFSFYINIDERYNDNTIRIVFQYENNIFGLKLKKDLYNDVKNILLTL